jgi:hypothetical protein
MSVSTSTDTAEPAEASRRPTVSVIVPFAGSRAEAQATADVFARLRVEPGDEAFLADNSVDGVLADLSLPAGWRVVRALREGSCAHPRNTAALQASGEWFLFIDADTVPPPELLDRFFADPIPDEVGIIGGILLSDERQNSLSARWAASRAMTAQHPHQEHPFRPFVLGACLLARRAVWEEVGGFLEGIFSGEDVDFCWHAQDEGWKLALSREAAIVHLHRETRSGLLKQAAARGASAAWIHRRWPNAARPKRPGPVLLMRGALAAPVLALVGQRERGALRALDVATELAGAVGRLRSNRARPRPAVGGTSTRRPLEVWCDQFPVVSETSVLAEARELARLGHRMVVVADRRPDVPAVGVHDLAIRYFEDETRLERLAAMAEVAARRPLACLRDLLDGLRWRREEEVAPLRKLAPSIRRLLGDDRVSVHTHFEAGAALNAMRATRIAGRSWSLTANAYDAESPRNAWRWVARDESSSPSTPA